MTSNSPEGVEYLKDQFYAGHKRYSENGGFSGAAGKLITELKFTLPGIESDVDSSCTFDAAIVLRAAGIRNDLNVLCHKPTLRGIGVPKGSQRTQTSVLGEAGELVFDQIGLGGALGFGKALLNDYWYHVEASVHHRINLVNGQDYGRIDAKTFLLHSEEHLPNNGFPLEGFEDMPEHASGVLLLKMCATMSAKQAALFRQNATNVNIRHDKTPRIVHRVKIPDSMFDNWGSNPTMDVFARFQAGKKEPVLRSFNVPIDPVVRETLS